MWRLLGVILIFQPNVVLGKLVGDHICLAEESYSANVTEYHVRNATVRSYQWCMNFPPRCSFYTTRKINETKSVEKNLTRIVEVCCEGFKESIDRCISKCHECRNGICENGKCICSSGYRGPTCDVACEEGLWGKHCSLRCNCRSNQCNPINGDCILNISETTTTYTTFKPITHLTVALTRGDEIKTESTTVSLNEQFTNITEMYVNSITLAETRDNVTNTILTRINENIEPTKIIYSKEQTYNTIPYITTKIHRSSTSPPKLYDTTTTPNQTKTFISAPSIPIIKSQATSPRTTPTFIPSSTIPISKYQTVHPITNVMEFSTATPKLRYPPISPVETEVIVPNILISREESTTTSSIPKTTSKEYASKKTQVPMLGNEYKEILIPVEIKYEPIKKHSYKKDALTTTPNNYDDDKMYSSIENIDYINGHVSSETYNTINHVSIAGTMILIIAILIISLIGIHNIRKSRTTKKEVEKGSCPAVALYTTSIFHTPLPDPPPFDNPTYITPAEYRKSPKEQITFKAHIICGNRNLDLANEIKECREYVYDHPPSTGSYRAVSTVEPSEINLSQSLTTLEPVYDEIPNRSPEVAETNLNYTIQELEPTTIYINTCGRTKF